MSADSFQQARVLFEELRSLPSRRWARELRSRDVEESVRQDVLSLLKEERNQRKVGAGTTNLQMRGASHLRNVVRGVALPKGTRIGPYTILQRIGEGPLGVVFMAGQEPPSQRWVALKVVDVGVDASDVLRRLESQRQAIHAMLHPNIARLLDAGMTDKEHLYAVTELVQGPPITEYCDTHSLHIRQRLELFVAVCRALQHAHDNDVVHGDLKPTNILVTVRDGGPLPRVVDFGFPFAIHQSMSAHSGGSNRCESGDASPEQRGGASSVAEPASDVYALGAVLYELLTGVVPCDGDGDPDAASPVAQSPVDNSAPSPPSERLLSLGEKARRIAERRSEKPRRLVRLLRREFDPIVMRCLARDVSLRPSSPAAIANDIEQCL